MRDRNCPVTTIRVPIAHIKSVVACLYGCSVLEIEGFSRAHVKPRHMAMTLAYQLNDVSNKFLARQFNKMDHTSIIHARNSVNGHRAEELAEISDIVLTAYREGRRAFREKWHSGSKADDEPPPSPIVKDAEPRATRFVPRRIKPAKKLFAAGRPRCVTGYLMGDPGSQSARIDRGEISGGIV
jgi:hypothetical protein